MDEQTSHYTVLARRFRPQSFEEVIGQAHVAQGLRNAIQKGKVAHAYLFTGARGVGKTSMARILAKSLNCPNVQDAHPCNACEICQSISAGNDVDVMEIDGASNRGIDDIRSLRANVNVKSMRSRYKIYIIDEVHMLTKEAFNALLKTLEEPPRNVNFIFCTTEPTKIPDTILSRCQRFDFSSIATTSIVKRLEQIAEAEGTKVDRDAVELVARRAAGSMRDSQSLFDQLLAFGEDRISAMDAHRLFGTASDDRLVGIVDALVEGRRDALLDLFGTALSEGVQLAELTDQLINYLRDLMVISTGADGVELLSVSNAARHQLTRQAQKWGLQTIVAAMQILAETKARMQRVTFGRSLVELALIRISLLHDLEDLGALISELRTNSPTTQQRGTSPPKRMRGQAPVPPETADAAGDRAGADDPENQKQGLQKKTETDQAAVHKSAVDALPAGGCVEIHEGGGQRLWAQILSRINDMLRNHAKRVIEAKSGPNRLDLTFPRRYHFQKQYCERAEVIIRLEEIAKGITGESIRISLFLADEDVHPADETQTSVPEKAEQRNPEPDEFVQKAMSVFDATVEKIVLISKSSPRKD